MPALGMAQETGKLLNWLKAEGEAVSKGEALMEVETDKAAVEVEAPASGILGGIAAQPGDIIPVGRVVAWVLAEGEAVPQMEAAAAPEFLPAGGDGRELSGARPTLAATPLARRVAERHGVDLAQVPAGTERLGKADVLAYLERRGDGGGAARLLPASPKARRLARERGLDLDTLSASGPEGAVLAADVLASQPATMASSRTVGVSSAWQLMAERVTHSWTTAPHFYLLRDVDAGELVSWRHRAQERLERKLTYSDLLVKLVASALQAHPRLNASWQDGEITLSREINVGLAVATEDGLVVPVFHRADELGLAQIADRREALVEQAQAGRLRLEDVQGGTFTISNLGMYGVDAFQAVVNPPQAGILAVGRIAERVVPVDGQASVRPMMTLGLSCDHRVVDGARGAQFLDTLAALIQEPLKLLD